MPSEPVARVLERSEGVRRCGDSWEARCPAHDDRRASLSIAEGRDGRVLMNCHAGCEPEAVVAGLGLEMRDLFPANGNGRRRIVAEYDYHDETGALLFTVCRTETKDFPQRAASGRWSMRGVRRVLFRLPQVLAAIEAGRTVYVPEGEKAVLALEERGLTATCSPGGAGKFRSEYGEHLRGARVVILPDNDDPGRSHARDVAAKLEGIAASVRVLELPDLPAKGDPHDWFATGGTVEEMERLAEDAPLASEWTPPEPDAPLELGTGRKPTQAELLMQLAEGEELWHTPEAAPYASFEVEGRTEHAPVRSKAFKTWLSHRFYCEHGKPPGSQALHDALSALEGRARFEGEEHPVYTRVAGHEGRIYIALHDGTGRAVEVDADGWRIVTEPPVRFRRSKGQLPLPEPRAGGTVELLRPFVNVATEEDFRLVLAWLVAALRPHGPYPILAPTGEQDSSKSTLCRIVRALVDPNTAALRSLPREERDLVIAAENGHVLAFDNVSRVAEWLSDALCRVATGGGYATRQLYSDSEEEVFDFQRPVTVNGIGDVLTRPDLRDRALVLDLPPIPDERRRPEREFYGAFEDARPLILGALLDGVSAALRNLPTTQLDALPRMADFALWVTAAEEGLGWEPGAFMAAYTENRAAAVSLTLEADPVAAAVMQLMEERDAWEGTATQLLARLEERVPEDRRGKRSGWPGAPHVLSSALKRVAPDLRRMGVRVDFARTESRRRRRLIQLTAGDAPPPVGELLPEDVPPF